MFNKFGRRDPKGFGRKPLSNNSCVNTVIRNIRKCGQHVCGVRDPNNVDPLFFYTIGIHSLRNHQWNSSVFGRVILVE